MYVPWKHTRTRRLRTMSKELEMQTYAYWNAMRTVVAPEDYITATVLISEVKNAIYLEELELTKIKYVNFIEKI